MLKRLAKKILSPWAYIRELEDINETLHCALDEPRDAVAKLRAREAGYTTELRLCREAKEKLLAQLAEQYESNHELKESVLGLTEIIYGPVTKGSPLAEEENNIVCLSTGKPWQNVDGDPIN